MWDLVKSMCLLHSSGPAVTIFGSARIDTKEPLYDIVRNLGYSLGRAGFAIMTGGGPGLMEAVNRGAQDAGARSLGCRMSFTFEQKMNKHVDRSSTVRHFFVRKVVMCRQACGFIVLPGGIGTLDELFEVLALIQTRKMISKPVVLFGSAYWAPLLYLMHEMVVAGTVAERDLTLLSVTDDITEVLELLLRTRTESQETASRAQLFTSENAVAISLSADKLTNNVKASVPRS